MEEYKPLEKGVDTMKNNLSDFSQKLSEATDNVIKIECVDGTYEIEADSFNLTFTLEGDVFEIRNIDTRDTEGVGSTVLASIHNYVDDNGFDVMASNVLQTAHGFWEKMGYQEGEMADEWFRAA